MPNQGDHGGAKTPARIAAIATELYLAKEFEEVAITEIAAAAGVSKVTVFKHLDRKEDILLDQSPRSFTASFVMVHAMSVSWRPCVRRRSIWCTTMIRSPV